MKYLIVIMLSSIAVTSYAARTYTKAELNRMVDSGNFPTQGATEVISKERVSFSQCRKRALGVILGVAGNYPYAVIVDTDFLYMAKYWTNEGVILVTCSKPDQIMLVNQASYLGESEPKKIPEASQPRKVTPEERKQLQRQAEAYAHEQKRIQEGHEQALQQRAEAYAREQNRIQEQYDPDSIPCLTCPE